MQHSKLIWGSIGLSLICGVLSDTDSNNDITKKQGGYSDNSPYSNQYYNNQQNQYSNNAYVKVVDGNSPYQYASTNNYNPTSNTNDLNDLFSSTAAERQDFLEGDTLSIFAAGLAAGAAIASTIALIQNSQQPSTDDFNKLKDRVSSLETDQTSICTSVKAFASADDGKTIATTYDQNSDAELGYLQALAAAASPTCS